MLEDAKKNDIKNFISHILIDKNNGSYVGGITDNIYKDISNMVEKNSENPEETNNINLISADIDPITYESIIQENVYEAFCEFERPSGHFERIFPKKEILIIIVTYDKIFKK